MSRQAYKAITLCALMGAGAFPPVSVAADQHQGMTLALGEADNATTVNVEVGSVLNVFLNVPPEERYNASCLWSPVIASGGDALQETVRKVLLPTGVTSASFRAVHPGSVQLGASRRDCAAGVTAAWRVEVRVS